jgi:hypothetical protein
MRASRLATTVVVVSTLVVALAASADAATAKPGGKCPKKGIVVHNSATNTDFVCTKKGSALVWVKTGGGSGSSGSGSGSSGSGSSAGVSSSAEIPKVLQNWALNIAPYDAATGKAGVMQIKGVQPPTFANPEDTAMYSHIVGLYGESIKGGIQEPQMGFYAPLGTPVISMLDGTVCDRPRLYSGDYSIRVAPPGVACNGGSASVLIEHEHLLSPTVNVGDKVTAGQQIGVVSDYNPHWKAKGFGLIETGVFFIKKSDPTRPWHACLANYLVPAKSAALQATLSSIETAWNTERNDPSLYNLAAQNPVGCLTQADITDSNSGQKQ